MSRDAQFTKIVRSRGLPRPDQFGPGAVLLHDRALIDYVPGFPTFAGAFRARVAVDAGESLKDVTAFPDHIARLVRVFEGWSRAEATLVCAGGGSVGDFGGFCASVIQRGIDLVHVPTTWLAAVDSAHGGKNALNVTGVKNQIGTFYDATGVYLVSDVLEAQPELRAREGMAELVKMALVDGGPWARRLLSENPAVASRNSILWRYLEPAIAAKGRVVDRDATETDGYRQILNFGHTLGHVLEAHHGLAHGHAVAAGLHFALEWSVRSAGLESKDHSSYTAAVAGLTGYSPSSDRLPPIPRPAFLGLLGADKKTEGRSGATSTQPGVTFIFLRELGAPLRRRVSLDAVAHEATRAGWLR